MLIESSASPNNAKYDNLPQKQSSRMSIEFIGDQAMKGIVRFNTDTYLLGINTFEIMSTFENIDHANKGIKQKFTQIDKLNSGIEKRQRRLDANVNDMAAQLQAFRDLKREVDTLNQF